MTGPQSELGEWLSDRMEPVLGFRPDGSSTYLGSVKNGQIVAVAAYDNFNGASVQMTIAGEGRKWMDRPFLWAMFDYPFNQLGVKKIIAQVSQRNLRSLNFALHLGAKREATIKDACPDGDMHLLTMTAENCKFLSIRRP